MGKMLELVEKIETHLAESELAWNQKELTVMFAEKRKFPIRKDVVDALDILVWGLRVDVKFSDRREFPSHTWYMHVSNKGR